MFSGKLNMKLETGAAYMEINMKIKFCSGILIAAALLPGYAAAEYHASTDTGVDILDYIENERQAERENALTDEQKQLLKDTEAMKAHLSEPLDPAKGMPVAVEGDDLSYDQHTGAVYAKGKVRITALDQRRFTTEEADGNLKTHDVDIEDKSHMLQLTPGQQRITMDGYKTHYNYEKQTGQMENAKGRVDRQYITAKRIEFYPDVVILYEGTATKCSAQKPDYHISAKTIELYKAKNRRVMYDVKYWLGHVVVHSEKYSEQEMGKDSGSQWPSVGYNNDDGLQIGKTLTRNVAKNVTAELELNYHTKQHFRNVARLNWGNAGNSASLKYGYFEDNNAHWIKKEPTFTYSYSNHLGGWPFSYTLSFEDGRWSQDGKTSNHTSYGISLSRDTIVFNNWYLYLSTGYSITKESYDHSMTTGFSYDGTLLRKFDDRWGAFVGYHYSHNNSQNSVFNYALDDYSRKLETGFSYRITPRDRFVAGWNYDVTGEAIKDIDYYWYHDLHCAQLILRYREKRNQWKIGIQLKPW